MKVRHVDRDTIEIEGRLFPKTLVRLDNGHIFWAVVNWKPGYILDLDTWVEREAFGVEESAPRH